MEEPIQCPHCLTSSAVEFSKLKPSMMYEKQNAGEAFYYVDHGYCQNLNCLRLIMRLRKMEHGLVISQTFIIPHAQSRRKFEYVPPAINSAYEEAGNVLGYSPSASAALARRCLQMTIREHFKIEKNSLYDEIQELVNEKNLPEHIVKGLDKVRGIGNLALHPEHDAQTGLIVEINKDEAEWTLDILETLFNYCFEEPKKSEQRTQRLEEKLDQAKNDKPKTVS